MTRFLLIRHATTDSVGKKLSGRREGVPLNRSGNEQAKELCTRLSKIRLSAILSSPVQRALETAAPLRDATGIDVEIMPEFNEIDFGEWTNAALDDLSADPLFSQFNTFRSNTRIPGGETMLEAQARFVRGLEQLTKVYAGKNVAVFSHADMIKAALVYYMGISIDLFQRLEISPASVSILEIFPETARVTLLNHVGDILM